MSTPEHFEEQKLAFTLDGVDLEISSMSKDGTRLPLVFLHGFGSTKEDVSDLAYREDFRDCPIIAYDAPGCGASVCKDYSYLSIPFLRKVAENVLRHYGVEKFHLMGHSMGGLTALYLAHENKNQVVSFTNIKGNVAPEDCFLSRQILDYPANDAQEFMGAFIKRAWSSPGYSNQLYASGLAHKVRAEAVSPIFRSMVELSDNDDLMAKFLGLPCSKMFVFGEQYRSLSYLNKLMQEGVQLAEIPASGHFPMYSNPLETWSRVSNFIMLTEQGASNERY